MTPPIRFADNSTKRIGTQRKSRPREARNHKIGAKTLEWPWKPAQLEASLICCLLQQGYSVLILFYFIFFSPLPLPPSINFINDESFQHSNGTPPTQAPAQRGSAHRPGRIINNFISRPEVLIICKRSLASRSTFVSALLFEESGRGRRRSQPHY